MSIPIIHFIVDKNDEKSSIVTQTSAYSQVISTAPVYSDASKGTLIGTITINKQIYNLDASLNVISGVTNAAYSYSVNWNIRTLVPGVSSFVIVPEDQVVSNGTSEVPGTYYGAVDGVYSSGNFRNYGGSVRKIKDATPIRQYTLDYYQSTPYNTLP
jgi:hypothetical protein